MNRWGVVGGLLIGLLAGCGSSTPNTSGKPKVAFVTNNPAEFWTIAEAGTAKAAKEFNVEVLFRRPSKGDAALQKEIIDTVVSQGVKAIAVSVIAPDAQREYFDGIAKQVPLITQDNDIPNGQRLCYIGTDNYEAGKAAGELVKEALPDGGAVAIFVGQLEPDNARQRRQGVIDALAGTNDAKGDTLGKYRLVGTYTDGTSGQKAKDNATDVLAKNDGEKNLALVGLWAYNAPAMLSAARDANKLSMVKLIGFDEDAGTLTGIADGHIVGTIVQDPFGFGYESVKLMAALARGDKSGVPAGGMKPVPHRVVTKAGGPGREAVEKFRAELNKLLQK